MADVTSVSQMSDRHCWLLIEELQQLDPKVGLKTQAVMDKIGVSLQEALEFVVVDNPILWAKVYLNWEARDYQFEILEQGKKSKTLVLRLGRRLGKTDSMCVLILWYAYTQINKGPNNQYDILILTPYETQIDLIFDRLKQLIQGSPLMQGMISRDVYHRLEFLNGTKILGLTAGAKSGGGSSNSRGQRADVIILDEVDEVTTILF